MAPDGAAEVRAAVAMAAPPRTAEIEAAMAERREMPSHPSAHPGMAGTYHRSARNGPRGVSPELVAQAGEERRRLAASELKMWSGSTSARSPPTSASPATASAVNRRNVRPVPMSALDCHFQERRVAGCCQSQHVHVAPVVFGDQPVLKGRDGLLERVAGAGPENPGLDGHVALAVEAHRPIVQIGGPDAQQPVIDDENLEWMYTGRLAVTGQYTPNRRCLSAAHSSSSSSLRALSIACCSSRLRPR